MRHLAGRLERAKGDCAQVQSLDRLGWLAKTRSPNLITRPQACTHARSLACTRSGTNCSASLPPPAPCNRLSAADESRRVSSSSSSAAAAAAAIVLAIAALARPKLESRAMGQLGARHCDGAAVARLAKASLIHFWPLNLQLATWSALEKSPRAQFFRFAAYLSLSFRLALECFCLR